MDRGNLTVLIVVIGVVGCLWAGRPTPYESYNSEINRCLVIEDVKQQETCLVAVNSGYVRMLNGQDTNRENTNKDKNNK